MMLMLCALLAAAACKKDGEQYTLQPGGFSGGALSASSTTIVLTRAAENDTALSFTWGAAAFGGATVVGYTLEIDVPADTSGANAWAQAKTFNAGNQPQGYSFAGKDLNNLLSAMGLPAGATSQVAVRVKAAVPQYNGAASTVTPVYSNTLVVTITTFSSNLYVPGDYQGWNPGSAPMFPPIEGKAGMYEGYVNMPGSGGPYYFKFTNSPDWDHTNYGDGGNGTFSTDGNAAGLSVPTGGYYYLTANLNTNQWTATAVTWGIIGDATPGGWDADTPMAYDAAEQVWKVTAQMKKNGSFKFRANNAWALDFGTDANGKLVYADNPFLGYTAGLNNLSVPEDGTYTIRLDLHLSGQYTYSVTKN